MLKFSHRNPVPPSPPTFLNFTLDDEAADLVLYRQRKSDAKHTSSPLPGFRETTTYKFSRCEIEHETSHLYALAFRKLDRIARQRAYEESRDALKENEIDPVFLSAQKRH